MLGFDYLLLLLILLGFRIILVAWVYIACVHLNGAIFLALAVVVHFVGFVLFFVVVVEEVLAHFEFKAALAVVVHYEAKCDGNNAEQTTNVG